MIILNSTETYTMFNCYDNNIVSFINPNYKKYDITEKLFIDYILGNPMFLGLNFIGLLTKNPNSIVKIHKFN